MASAAQINDGSGVPYEVGTQITGTSTDMTLETEGLGTLECESISRNLELTENGPQFEAESAGSGTTSNCSLEGNAIEITDLTTLLLKSLGTNEFIGTISESVTFIAHLPTVTCHFAGQLHGTYLVGGNTMHVDGFLDGGACGDAVFEANITYIAAGGGTVAIV